MFMPPRKQRRQNRSSSSVGSVESNGRGRPMKRTVELRPSRKARTQQAGLIYRHLATKAASARTSTLSKLEELPVEILEIIFFYCLELNLPRASPNLAQSLSQQSIYTALVLLAYYEADSTAGQPDTKHVETHHFKPATFRRITRDERVRLQESIFQCRWFTLTFFEQCLPILARLKMVECWYVEETALKVMIQRRSPAQQTALPPLNLDALLPILTDKSAMESHFCAKIQHHRPRQKYVDTAVGPTNDDGYLPFINTATSWRENGARSTWESRPVLTVRVLPDLILQGAPWTDSKIKLLQFFRQCLRYEAHDRTLVVSLDAVFAGMASAISEGNEKALLVLLELHHTVLKCTAAIREETSGPIYPPPNPLPLSLFHLACQETAWTTTRAQSRTMSLLLSGGVEGIPFDDVVMTRWAAHVRSRETSSGEEVRMARWLLSHMEERASSTSGSRLEATDYLYRQPSNGRSFTSRIGYLRSGCPPDGRWSINPPHAPGDN